jgi:hypothetical protein
LLVAGYGLSAVVKGLLPMAQSVIVVLGARVAERFGKGCAMHGATLCSQTSPFFHPAAPTSAFASRRRAGFVVGPLLATVLVRISGDDYRLVFPVALSPPCKACVSGAVALVVAIAVRAPTESFWERA